MKCNDCNYDGDWLVEYCDTHMPECLDLGDGPCRGDVGFRQALSATGRSFPRCDRHWVKRMKVQEGINRRYPDTPTPPRWFDPADAGEEW